VAALLVGSACSRTFHGAATQPNPLAEPLDTLRASEKITIVTSDMELDEPDAASGYTDASQVHNHHYPLRNAASFTIVSRDRLRFHVQIDHKWPDYADLSTWQVYLVDDQGHRWTPEAMEHARTKIMTSMWDREQRTSICDGRGRDGHGDCITTIGFANDGWKHRQSLGSLSVYRGNADFVFYQRDIFSPAVKQLRLVVKRSGESFEFTWNFADDVATQ